MLSYYGIKNPDATYKRSWTKAHMKFLETIQMVNLSGNISLKLLLEELKFLNEQINKLNNQISMLSCQSRYKIDFENLITSPGIGKLSALVILTELIDIKRFKSLIKLNSFVGLIPSEHSSGEKQIRYKITRRGNPYLKKTLIECAWSAIRKDPALLMSFKQYCNRMNSNQAIIKIARKLLNRIRYILINKKPYELGIVK